MGQTRRQFVADLAEAVGILSLVAGIPTDARAYLLGTWWLVCPYDNCDRIDRVDGGTKQHLCSKCGRQMFYGPRQTLVTIACPEPYLHPNSDVDTDGELRSFRCTTCGIECQMYKRDTRRDPPDRGR